MPNDFVDALSETCGAAIGDGYLVPFGGACPVQGYGHIDGHFTHHGEANNTGWQSAACSIAQIEEAVEAFRSHSDNMVPQ